jgi:prepilin signal peptidase PulO-like enzyme (type II secretory pathway)
MIIAILILLGLCFGSFTGALVWRLHEQSLPAKQRKAGKQELSMTKGRSMCERCGHTLQVIDLIPVLSWISLRGRCRYCKQPISWQAPVLELVTASLFVSSYLYWPEPFGGWKTINFGLWLVCLVGLIALIVYDLRWMLLPNRIIFPLYGVTAAFILTMVLSEHSLTPLYDSLTGILIGGGLFYFIFLISNGRWIGGGDVKLGFLLGALVGGPLNAAILLFLASLMGSAVSLPLILSGKASRSTRIPFGPFLIAAATIVLLFGTSISGWYVNNFIDI